MTDDEFSFMVDIVGGALTQAGVIEDEGVYGESDLEIDRDLGDDYSIEIHDLTQERPAEVVVSRDPFHESFDGPRNR